MDTTDTAAWKCAKTGEIDHRPEHEGVSLQFLCVLDRETATAHAIINPSECLFVHLSTMPTRRGVGKAVEPLIEEELKQKGRCKTIFALPKSTAGERLLRSTYWRPTYEWSKQI